MLSACVDHWGYKEGDRQMRVKRLFSKVGQVQCGDAEQRGLGAEQEGELQKAFSKQSLVNSKEPHLASSSKP